MQSDYRNPPIIDQAIAAKREPGVLERTKNAILYLAITTAALTAGLLAGLFAAVFAAIFTVVACVLLGSIAGRQLARAIVLKQHPELQVVWSRMRRWRYGDRARDITPPDQR
ncbi:MAG: hypothetical protein GDA41_11085 [Rhodospirillales bacterium]|nr:hypothetical protein [Rhodospirillales bacterium]